MSDMVRKQIYLERSQVLAIQRKAEVLGVNESELIRQAIDHDLYGGGEIPSRPDPTAWDEIEAFLASQTEKPLVGEPYRFNREELYDERLGRIHGTNPD
jgi:hypothetical protein